MLRSRLAQPATVLFLSLFTSQAAFLVLGPILTEVARDLGVSSAAAGQLRAVSGVCGGLTAVALAVVRPRRGPRAMLALGAGLVVISSLASAAAPSLAALAAAQAVTGVALGLLLSAGIAAVNVWAPGEDRARVLSVALLGQPAAWVVGMPAIGAVAEHGWRWAFLAVPLTAALVTLGALAARAPDPPVAAPAARLGELLRDGRVARWAAGELLAYAAWSGVLVYAGALMVEAHGASPQTAGVLLGGAALAYFPGSMLARRVVERHARRLLAGLGLALAAGATVFGAVRPSLAFSAAALAAVAMLTGGRTLAGSTLGLQLAGRHAIGVTSVRTAAVQFGNLAGAGLGGLALGLGGYDALGATLGVIFVAAALPHAGALRPEALGQLGRLAQPPQQRVVVQDGLVDE